MLRGAWLLSLCLGCQTFYHLPDQAFIPAAQDPDRAHVALRAFRLKENGCSLNFLDAVPTFVKMSEVEIQNWDQPCTRCAKIRNKVLIADITLLSVGLV